MRLPRSGDPDTDPRAGTRNAYRRPAVRQLVPSGLTRVVHEAIAGRRIFPDLSNLQMFPTQGMNQAILLSVPSLVK